jgi:hypothetical protein
VAFTDQAPLELRPTAVAVTLVNNTDQTWTLSITPSSVRMTIRRRRSQCRSQESCTASVPREPSRSPWGPSTSQSPRGAASWSSSPAVATNRRWPAGPSSWGPPRWEPAVTKWVGVTRRRLPWTHGSSLRLPSLPLRRRDVRIHHIRDRLRHDRLTVRFADLHVQPRVTPLPPGGGVPSRNWSPAQSPLARCTHTSAVPRVSEPRSI